MDKPPPLLDGSTAFGHACILPDDEIAPGIVMSGGKVRDQGAIVQRRDSSLAGLVPIPALVGRPGGTETCTGVGAPRQNLPRSPG